MEKVTFKHISISIVSLLIVLASYLAYKTFPDTNWANMHIDNTFYGFIVVGFIAQLIDGALGMAYGISCTSLLLYLGISPKLASAAVHTAEVFTTGASGLSHLKFKNIDKKLFSKLVFTGVLGAMVGAYLISEVFDGKVVKPYISAYLFILGIVILAKGIRNKKKEHTEVKYARLLAFIGGFCDTIGGGGWGPIVTSNIINQGKDPKETIGTVNTAEFFVSFFGTGVFLFFVGVSSWQIVLGLIIGGVLAAPIGAYLVKKINKRLILIMVGLVIMLTSSYSVYTAIMK